MEEQKISFDTAKLAKEKGFNIFDENELGYASNQKVYDPDGTLCTLSFETNPHQNKKWFELCKCNSSDRKDPKNKRIFDIKSSFEPEGIDTYLVQTQTLLQKWLRDTHKIFVNVHFISSVSKGIDYTFVVRGEFNEELNCFGKNVHGEWEKYNSWEETLEAGLVEGLKFIKNCQVA